PAAKPDKKTVRADDGLNLVCETRGQGDTALVFLHGWRGDREYWKHQADAFAAAYRLVTRDPAGHGESGKDRKAWVASGRGGRAGEVAPDPGRGSGPDDGAGPDARPLRPRPEEAVEGGQGAGAVHQLRRRVPVLHANGRRDQQEVRRLQGGHHRRGRPLPDAGE